MVASVSCVSPGYDGTEFQLFRIISNTDHHVISVNAKFANLKTYADW
jgi:hypothetical protein